MDNCFLFDWLTVSFSDDFGFADIIGLLGIDRCIEEQKTGSRLKYGHRLAFDGISVHYTDDSDKRHNAGVCLEMSGQGCRDFETFGSGDWVDLFTSIAEMHGVIHAAVQYRPYAACLHGNLFTCGGSFCCRDDAVIRDNTKRTCCNLRINGISPY